ncbi:PAS domain S-box protein [Atopomonas sediminilitoris]|uniref:PAS domain S-box protein n=1 Tax=Atopomonas sediminilitoris TaxID=2919919 RepID=UPI001F4DB30A|nr:PAS domain S-box protein [Atopomonas sediminilitoris]MCJ8167838.1 PAS domain S-box protein [Atopomonas sediminilitoris]
MKERVVKLLQRWGLSVVVLLLGALLTLVAMRYLQLKDQQQLQNRLQLIGGERMALILTQMHALTSEMDSLQRFYAYSDDISRGEFEGYTASGLSLVQGMAWLPRVVQEQRAAHEALQQADGLEGYKILDLGEDDLWRPASSAPEYFPIAYLASLQPVGAALGFNLFSHPTPRALLERATDTGQPVLSDDLPLVGIDSAISTQLLISPVFTEAGATAPQHLRRSQLKGFLLVSFSLQRTVERLLGTTSFNGLLLSIKDTQQSPDQRLANFPLADEPTVKALGGVVKTITVADRELEICIEALPAFVAAYRDERLDGLPWLGGSLTLLVAVLVWVLTNQRETAMGLVRARTALLEQRGREVANLEARWRVALDSAGDGIWEWDLEQHILSFCDRYLERLGYTAGEFGTREDEWLARVHEEDRDDCQHAVRRHVRGETPLLSMEYRLRNQAGDYMWVLDRGQVMVRDEHGRALRMMGTQTDIHTLKNAQAHAIEAQRYLQSVLDAATEVAIVATDINGKITLFNAGAQFLYGYRAEEVVGRETPLLLHDPLQIKALSEELERNGLGHYQGFAVLVAQARLGETDTRDWRMRHKNGQWREVSLRITPIRNAQGGLEGFLGIAVDVTERREAIRQLKVNDERLRKLASQVPGALFQYQMAIDGSTSFSFLSEGVYKLFDLSESVSEVNASRVFALLHEDDRERVQTTIRLCYEQRSSNWHNEFRIKTLKGEVRWLRGEATTEAKPDGRFVWYGYLSDVSLQKKLEASCAG